MLVSPPVSCPPPDAASAETVCRSPSLHWSRTGGWSSVAEKLTVEAPLAIEIAYARGAQQVRKVLAVTMRTPGHDEELALGFLFAEGLIAARADVVACSPETENARGETVATQRVQLARAPREELQRVSRGVLTSSACGLCGRVSLEGLPMTPRARTAGERVFACELIARLPEELRRHQAGFFETGGSHAAALCDAAGQVVLAREDVGRHNAVDKLVGAGLQRRMVFGDTILVLSGRASFELVQKAAAAGIPLIVAVGAPSSLAVSLAHAAGITLVGFARGDNLNIYAHSDRISGV